MAVVGGTNGAAEEHELAVTLSGMEYLPGVPGKRRSVERDEHQSRFGTGDATCSRQPATAAVSVSPHDPPTSSGNAFA